MNEFIVGTWIASWFAILVKIGVSCFLQWKLAQKEEWYLGLILPFLYFWQGLPEVLASEPVRMGGVFLARNVETLILLVFYGIFRTNLKHKKEYEAMKVKDL